MSLDQPARFSRWRREREINQRLRDAGFKVED
jgi:hypothetical protein